MRTWKTKTFLFFWAVIITAFAVQTPLFANQSCASSLAGDSSHPYSTDSKNEPAEGKLLAILSRLMEMNVIEASHLQTIIEKGGEFKSLKLLLDQHLGSATHLVNAFDNILSKSEWDVEKFRAGLLDLIDRKAKASQTKEAASIETQSLFHLKELFHLNDIVSMTMVENSTELKMLVATNEGYLKTFRLNDGKAPELISSVQIVDALTDLDPENNFIRLSSKFIEVAGKQVGLAIARPANQAVFFSIDASGKIAVLKKRAMSKVPTYYPNLIETPNGILAMIETDPMTEVFLFDAKKNRIKQHYSLRTFLGKQNEMKPADSKVYAFSHDDNSDFLKVNQIFPINSLKRLFDRVINKAPHHHLKSLDITSDRSRLVRFENKDYLIKATPSSVVVYELDGVKRTNSWVRGAAAVAGAVPEAIEWKGELIISAETSNPTELYKFNPRDGLRTFATLEFEAPVSPAAMLILNGRLYLAYVNHMMGLVHVLEVDEAGQRTNLGLEKISGEDILSYSGIQQSGKIDAPIFIRQGNEVYLAVRTLQQDFHFFQVVGPAVTKSRGLVHLP